MRTAEHTRWIGRGLWMMTRDDPDYPERLKRRLKHQIPAALYGCGDTRLLRKGGLAVVGSRDAQPHDVAYTHGLGEKAAAQGFPIVSGCARGVDQTAMLGALDRDGEAVGVVGDSLLKVATGGMYRQYVMSGQLVLVSPFHPESPFSVIQAMTRNRYIYCLSDAAVVISSVAHKGGTWSGASQALRQGWVSVWVKDSSSPTSGNHDLMKRGGRLLPPTLPQLGVLFAQVDGSRLEQLELDF